MSFNTFDLLIWILLLHIIIWTGAINSMIYGRTAKDSSWRSILIAYEILEKKRDRKIDNLCQTPYDRRTDDIIHIWIKA